MRENISIIPQRWNLVYWYKGDDIQTTILTGVVKNYKLKLKLILNLIVE